MSPVFQNIKYSLLIGQIQWNTMSYTYMRYIYIFKYEYLGVFTYNKKICKIKR